MPTYKHYGIEPSRPVEQLPASLREMAEYNLGRLGAYDFEDVLAQESYGGNARHEHIDGKPWLAAAVNGIASTQSGRFAAFENRQLLPPELLNDPRYEEVSIRMGTHYEWNDKLFVVERRILDVTALGAGEFTPYAVDAMLGAVALFNEAQGPTYTTPRF
jgi:hypothetical protein